MDNSDVENSGVEGSLARMKALGRMELGAKSARVSVDELGRRTRLLVILAVAITWGSCFSTLKRLTEKRKEQRTWVVPSSSDRRRALPIVGWGGSGHGQSEVDEATVGVSTRRRSGKVKTTNVQ